MKRLPYIDSTYVTPPGSVSIFARTFPEVAFYIRFAGVVLKASQKAKRGKYGDREWCESSYNLLKNLEGIGLSVEITGIHHIAELQTPCVVIANHMSILETLVLPVIINPARRMTFVVKDSLLKYPVFRHVMRARNPISVSRTNPRQDYKVVLDEGLKRLEQRISVVVFPQRTRAASFDPAQFNSIGVKLAARAGVPVVPLALMTHAWKNGKYIKELGTFDVSQKVCFAFGPPIWVEGRGSNEHQRVINFMLAKLNEWNFQYDR